MGNHAKDPGNNLSDRVHVLTAPTPQPAVPRTAPGLERLLDGPVKHDLAVTAEAHDYFTAMFNDYREALCRQRKIIRQFPHFPDVVTHTSALNTNKHLSENARYQVLASLDQYLWYLDAYKAAVDAATSAKQAHDQAN